MKKPKPAYAGDEPFIFISYAHADEDEVLPEVAWLQSHDLNVWWDEGIGGGSRWRDEIAERILHCHLVLFYVSPNSMKSSVCREEFEYALAHHRPILMIYLADAELPDGIKLASSNRQALFRHELEQADYERKLLDAIAQLLGQEPIAPQRAVQRGPNYRVLIPTLLASFVVVLGISIVATWWLVKPPPEELAPSAQFYQLLPVAFAGAGSTHLTINGAGTHIYALGTTQYPDKKIFVRPLDAFQFQPIPGTEFGGELIGIIPDHQGQSLLLTHRNGDLGRISTSGGNVIPIADSNNNPFQFHARWSGPQSVLLQNHDIIEALNWQEGPVARKTLVEGGIHPFPIPGGEYFLYSKIPAPGEATQNQVTIRNLVSGEEKTLLEGADPRLTPANQLLFFRDDAVWATRFSLDQLKTMGEPVKVIDNLHSPMGKIQYEFSDNGTMVYLPPFEVQMGLRWVSREGLEKDLGLPGQSINSIAVSPDETAVAISGGDSIRLFTFEDELTTKLRTSEGQTLSPVWLDGGNALVFTEYYFFGPVRMFKVDINSLEVTLLLESELAVRPLVALPDESAILVEACTAFTVNCDILRLDATGSGELEVVIDSDANERAAVISPNGQFLAYSTDAFGPKRIVIRPYPDVTASYLQVPLDNCTKSEWSKAGSELLIDCDGSQYVVPVSAVDGKLKGEPSLMFQLPRQYFYANYVSGREQFLFVKQENVNNLFVVKVNWFDELEREISRVNSK